MEHTCIILNTDNTFTIKKFVQSEIDGIFGGITFVGAIPQFNVFAVACKNSEGIINNYCTNTDYFDIPIKGPVILIGSDYNGNAIDLDADSILNFLENNI